MHRIGRPLILALAAVTMVSFSVRAIEQQAPTPTPTFAKDVAPILYNNCTSCHRAGEMAPMSLITYDEVRPWARSIRENVRNGVMPPWHVDAPAGKFVNDRRLTDDEKDTIVRWVNGGSPKGNLADLPPVPEYQRGWSIGTPDAIVRMATPFRVPSEGEVEYQYFEAPTNLTEDRWVQAMEIRPGSRQHVHHILVYAREPNPTPRPPVLRPIAYPAPPPRDKNAVGPAGQQPQSSSTQGVGRRGPLFASTAPGTNATVLTPGTAMMLKAGSILTFQIHYTTNGQAGTDVSMIGFKFAKEPPAIEVRATAMINNRFAIPPGASDHSVPAGLEALADITIYRLAPHTHLRGKSWQHKVTYPDGRTETVLSVPRYDFNWQTDYVFVEPLKLPKGSKLESMAVYDNSKANKANPDPKAEVRWGDQTWEEMQYTAVTYSVDATGTTAQQR
jgi:hypothetical protein